MFRNRVALRLLVAPIVGVATGVLAEWADLNPPLLLAIAVPALIVSTLSAASPLRARPLAVTLTGAALGLVTFMLSAGVYLAIHYARGGSQEDAGVFFTVHLGVGAALGLAIGVALTLVLTALRFVQHEKAPA